MEDNKPEDEDVEDSGPKTLMRSVTVWNDETGRNETLMPGDPLPDWAKDKVTNPKVFVPQGYTVQEWEDYLATEEDLGETEEEPPDPDDLDAHTVPQLRELAEAEKVDLTGISRKAEIIKAIEDKRASNS